MKTVKASEFKAKCLKIMDEVAESGEEVVVTKHGTPVGRFVPYRRRPRTLHGLHAGEVSIHYDLTEPLGEEWDAAR